MLVTEPLCAEQNTDKDLTVIHPRQLSAVMIELTNRCNLRCAFCTTGHPKYAADDLSHSDVNKIIRLCQEGGVRDINVSGHGETTIANGWQDIAISLLKQGFRLSITSNLAKSFSASEIALLSKFAFIGTSIDTMDSLLLRQMRCKVDLKTILSNLLMIRSQSLAENRTPPKFGITSVVFHENIYDLERIIGLAAAVGGNVFVNSPIEFEGLDQRIALTHPMKLRGPELEALVGYIGQVIRLARSLGVPLKLDETLVDYLATAKHCGTSDTPYQSFQVPLNPGQPDEIGMHFWSRRPGPGQTRLCLDPWSMLLFERHGAILNCCIGLPATAHISNADHVGDIINSPAVRKLRKSLLTGNLPLHCKYCARKPLVEIQALQQMVAALGREI